MVNRSKMVFRDRMEGTIDHTKVGEVVPLPPNEHLSMFSVDKPMRSLQGNTIVYEVAGMRMVEVKLISEEAGAPDRSEMQMEQFGAQKRYKDFETLRQ